MNSQHGWLIFFICCVAVAIGMWFIVANHAHAETYPIMSQQEREKIFNQIPNFQTTSNYYFQIIITPAGAQLNNVIVSGNNLTAIKNNVGFFTACGAFSNGLCQPPILTTQNPTSNYCPIAKMILLNQDGYLSKLYNATSGKDLTNYVYPTYCHVETGPNPINGDNSIPVPEFEYMASAILMVSMILFFLGQKRLKK